MKSSNPRKLVRIRHKTERQSIGLHEGLLSVNPWSKGWASPRNFFGGEGYKNNPCSYPLIQTKFLWVLKCPTARQGKSFGSGNRKF